MVDEFSPWFSDLYDLGPVTSVLNDANGNIPYDVRAIAGDTFEESGQRTVAWIMDHSFLNDEAPGTTLDSFACGFAHAIAGHDGQQYWSADGSFYPPDHGGGPEDGGVCLTIGVGISPPDFAGRDAGVAVTNTDGSGDFLAYQTKVFGLGFMLQPWLDLFGPNAGFPIPTPPDNATIEWENGGPINVTLEAAADEDVTVTQTGLPDSSVTWRLGGDAGSGFRASWNELDDVWEFPYGAVPDGPIVALEYEGGVGGWTDITSYVDLDNLGATTFDLQVTAYTGIGSPPSVSKPGSADYYRQAQFLALRLTFRANRYRWVYDRPPVTRQFPRDDEFGLVGGPRVFPPPRRGRVFGGQQ